MQAAFVFARIAEMAPNHPEWQTTQPYQAVLEQDTETFQSLSAEDVEKLIFTTHAGMTEEEFEAEAKAFLDTAKHPRFGVPYTETVYQPMLELLAFLRANDFKTHIVSGGGVEFMRTFSEEVYGISRENVIGSSLQYEFQQTSDGSVLVRQPELVSFDDRRDEAGQHPTPHRPAADPGCRQLGRRPGDVPVHRRSKFLFRGRQSPVPEPAGSPRRRGTGIRLSDRNVPSARPPTCAGPLVGQVGIVMLPQKQLVDAA